MKLSIETGKSNDAYGTGARFLEHLCIEFFSEVSRKFMRALSDMKKNTLERYDWRRELFVLLNLSDFALKFATLISNHTIQIRTIAIAIGKRNDLNAI